MTQIRDVQIGKVVTFTKEAISLSNSDHQFQIGDKATVKGYVGSAPVKVSVEPEGGGDWHRLMGITEVTVDSD